AHHQSITIGTDRLDMYSTESTDDSPGANYNFYMDETYQGRAPGRIISKSVDYTEVAEDHLRLVQNLHWQSPSDWANAAGLTVAEETRTIDVYPGDVANIIDIRSRLRPIEGDIRVGGTVHGYFVVRMADGLRPVDGGTLIDSAGRTGAAEIRGQLADWVDCSGRAAHGQNAGVAVFPYSTPSRIPWHLSDWGFIMVNPFQVEAKRVNRVMKLRRPCESLPTMETRTRLAWRSFTSPLSGRPVNLPCRYAKETNEHRQLGDSPTVSGGRDQLASEVSRLSESSIPGSSPPLTTSNQRAAISAAGFVVLAT
ncbi:MAG: PmoA family protein, partial [Chloroflexi bacterium]|nr:PmoA family protein [Chloroflexota bacterium]